MAMPIVLLAVLAASSDVSKVVVYPDRAQVTRTATLRCGPRAVATFEGLPPAADPQSFRAKVDVGVLEGLTAEERPRKERFSPQLEQLEADLRKLEQEIAALDDQRARSEQLSALGGKYADIAVTLVDREMAEPRPNIKAWSTAFDTALATRLKASADLTDLAVRRRALDQRRAELRYRQAQMNASAERREHRVEALVSCPEGKQAKVELTYLVGGAGWTPAYEARAQESAGAVELSTFATLQQSTGETWSQAQLVLSTAVPLQNATPPEIRPLQIWSEEKKAEKKVLVRREEYQEHAQAGGEGQGAETAASGVRAASQGLSVQLEVPERADVPGDGTPVRLFVAKNRMKASFAYRTVPKQLPFVFRAAELTNTAPFPLLPGPLDAYRQTGFIARYELERVAQGAKLQLTFGLEDGLRVKRTVVEEAQKDAGFLGSKKRFKYAYRFELANYRDQSAQVELAEHVPVSELDDIQVELEPSTTKGYALAAQDGIATWKLELAPSEKKTVELAFHVDVPSSYESGGL